MIEKYKLWYDALVAKGHTPVMDDGRIDIWVVDEGYHNGPGCKACGRSWCWHCYKPDDVTECSCRKTAKE